MDRRKFIGTLSTATAIGLAGCSDNNDTPEPADDDGNDDDDENPPNEPSDLRGAYIPDHKDEMEMLGMQSDGRINIALMYAVPHEFTLVTGTRTEHVEIQSRDTMHIMVSVWDNQTGILPPSVEPSITIYRDDTEVTNLNPWAMLSQQMGFHFGDNVQVSGAGQYRFEIDLNAETSAVSNNLDGVFTETSFTFEQEFDPFDAQSLNTMGTDNVGEPGAIPPMDMGMMPIHTQPAYADMPIDMTDSQHTNDMAVAVGALDSAGEYGDDTAQRLVVSPQTRYNRYLMPLLSAEATVERNGETIYDDSINSSLHEDLGLFYGANISELRDGDTVTVTFNAPSQMARGLGYEEAFLQLDDLEFTI